VTDEMLERRLEDLREPMAEITPVEREVRTGDIAVIDIEVEVDGKIVESETRKATEAEVREGVLLPELIAVLPGSFMDETREANVKFPESYSNPELAGKEATIRVTVRGVKEKLLPALDETLVMSLTGGKQESVEAYRQSVRDELKGQVAELKKSSAARRYFASRLRRIRVLEHLLKNAGS